MGNFLCILFGIVLGCFVGAEINARLYKRVNEILKEENKNQLINVKNSLNKFRNYFDVLVNWIKMENMEKGFDYYFRQHNYQKIAIYGVGKVGVELIANIEKNCSSAYIEYLIDKKIEVYGKYHLYKPKDKLPSVDLIIVSATFDYEAIKNSINSESKIVSLEEIVNEMVL